jgi:predicted  nucleic acid-binding Zn-ribbon protein
MTCEISTLKREIAETEKTIESAQKNLSRAEDEVAHYQWQIDNNKVYLRELKRLSEAAR